MPDLAAVVSATPRRSRPVLLGVDGVDGSGKTTFAHALERAFAQTRRPARVVHLDDFLHPRRIRWRRGRSSPEGFFLDTYDLEAFTAKVLDPLARGEHHIVGRHFDHRTDTAVEDQPVPVGPDTVVIVEGMFLHREELATRWDVSVFLEVPVRVSLARLAARDGSSADPDDPSVARYVEGQRIYLARCEPQRRATVLIDNS